LYSFDPLLSSNCKKVSFLLVPLQMAHVADGQGEKNATIGKTESAFEPSLLKCKQ
jgi:hypothetical protein